MPEKLVISGVGDIKNINATVIGNDGVLLEFRALYWRCNNAVFFYIK